MFIALSSFKMVDQHKHEGVWKGVDKGEVGYVGLLPSGHAYFVIEGDTMGGKSFMVQGVEASMKYTVDYSTSPYNVDFRLYLAESDAPMVTMPGIFKFDANQNMVLCMSFKPGDRPTSFVEDQTIVLKKVSN